MLPEAIGATTRAKKAKTAGASHIKADEHPVCEKK